MERTGSGSLPALPLARRCGQLGNEMDECLIDSRPGSVDGRHNGRLRTNGKAGTQLKNNGRLKGKLPLGNKGLAV